MEQDKFQKFVDETFQPARRNALERAKTNRQYYDWLLWAITILSFISAVSIGIEAFFDLLFLKVLAALTSIAVTTLTGLLKSKGYQEKATSYSRLLYDLDTEWDFYQAGIEHYAKDDDPERLFVARIRLLLNEAAKSIPNMSIPLR